MQQLKVVAQSITDDLNSEESILIEMMEKGTDWLFKLVLFLGVPIFAYVSYQFLQL
ncbi:hypothetical protein SAMN05192533_12120 [Mesobacillus persicus]|uniref:Uncharacterized protein n=1 Tax=Mesobacillus persicus TaxID=930146 RepID=A0A1H8JFY9_9BACI|nr:hypothetical protein [Mesobacillus persicus]SEN79679.1 hypothetical protein SAMN05192533_12120 [Mesobacillus persicus]